MEKTPSRDKPPGPLCCLYGAIKDIGNVTANVEGVVI